MEEIPTNTDMKPTTNNNDNTELLFDFLDFDDCFSIDSSKDAELQLEVKNLMESLNLPNDINSVPSKTEQNGYLEHEDLHAALEKENKLIDELRKQSRCLEMDLAKHESKISDVMGNLFKVRVERDKLQETYGNAEQDNAQRAIRVQQLEVELSMFIELKKKRKVDLGARAEVWDKLTAVTAENESLNVSIAEMNSTLNATNNALRKKRALHRHLLKIITDFAKALTARGTLTPSLKEKFSALNEELKLEYSNNPELEDEISKLLKLKVEKQTPKKKRNENGEIHLSSTSHKTPTESSKSFSSTNKLSSNEHSGFQFEANVNVCEIDSSSKKIGNAVTASQNTHLVHGKHSQVSSEDKFDYEDHFFDVNLPINSDDELDISIEDLEQLRKQVFTNLDFLKAVSPIPEELLQEEFSERPTSVNKNFEENNRESDFFNQHLASYKREIESQHLAIASNSSVNETPKRPQLLHQHSEGFSFEQDEPSKHSPPDGSTDHLGSFEIDSNPDQQNEEHHNVVAKRLPNGLVELNFSISNPLNLDICPESLSATLTYGSFSNVSDIPPFKKIEMDKELSSQYHAVESDVLIENSNEQLPRLSQNDINVALNSLHEFNKEHVVDNSSRKCRRKKDRVQKHDELLSDEFQLVNHSENTNNFTSRVNASTEQTDASKDVQSSLMSEGAVEPNKSNNKITSSDQEKTEPNFSFKHSRGKIQSKKSTSLEKEETSANFDHNDIVKDSEWEKRESFTENNSISNEIGKEEEGAHEVDSPKKCKLVKVNKNSRLKSKKFTSPEKEEISATLDHNDILKDSESKKRKSFTESNSISNECGKEEEGAHELDSVKKCKLVKVSKHSMRKSKKSTSHETDKTTVALDHNDIVKDSKPEQNKSSKEDDKKYANSIIDLFNDGNHSISNECEKVENTERENSRPEYISDYCNSIAEEKSSKFVESSQLIERNRTVNNEIDFPSILWEPTVALVSTDIEKLGGNVEFPSSASKSKNKLESFVTEDNSNEFLFSEPTDSLDTLEKTNTDSLQTNRDTDSAFCSNESIVEAHNIDRENYNELANDDCTEEFMEDTSLASPVAYEQVRSNLLKAFKKAVKGSVQHLEKGYKTLVKDLLNSKNAPCINTILLAAIEHLTKSKKIPLFYYSLENEASDLLPALEECIINAFYTIQYNVGGAFDSLLPTAMKSLYFIIPFKEQIQVCGLSALCRVFTKICRVLNCSTNALMLCSRLLKMRHKFAPYLIASIAGVWKELFRGISKMPDIEDLFLQCLAYGAAQRPKDLNDAQWNSCIDFLSKNLKAPPRFDVLETCTTVKHNILKLVQEGSFSEFDFMVGSPLVILSAFQSWTWTKTTVLDSFVLPYLKNYSTQVSYEKAFKFFCHIYTDILMLCPDEDSDHSFLMSLFLHSDADKEFSYVQLVTAYSLMKLCVLKKSPLPKCLKDWMQKYEDDTEVYELDYLREVGYSIQENDLSSDNIILNFSGPIQDI